MTATLQPVTPSALKRHRLVGGQLFDTGAFALSRDGRTVFGASGSQLRVSTAVLDTPATPGWSTVRDFGGGQIVGLIELGDGEVLVGVGAPNTYTQVWRSTGWSSGRASAGWTQVLSSNASGGYTTFDANYNWHRFGNGSNGVVVMQQSGPQTAGGAGSDGSDEATRAVHAYISEDFGRSWRTLFNLRGFAAARAVAYPANVHLHGIGSDEGWDRIWICYGDGPGDGKTIAGAGFAQVVWSDDRGQSWQRLPNPDSWATYGNFTLAYAQQFIAPAFNDRAIIFTPDTTQPVGTFVIRKAGYRQLGASELVLGSPGVGGQVTEAGGHWFCPGVADYGSGAGSYPVYVLASPDLLGWDQMVLGPVVVAGGSARGVTRVIGPNANGRLLVQLASTPLGAAGCQLIGDMVYG